MTYQRLIDMLQLQAANLPGVQLALSVPAGMITDVENDLADLIAMMDYAEVVDSNKKAIVLAKSVVYGGNPLIPLSPLPTFPSVVFAAGHPQTGCLERAQARNKFFKAAPAYTEEIGVALGIAGSPQTIDPGTVVPFIEATAAQSDYLFSVVVSGRGKSDMWDVQTTKVGANSWSIAKSATGKSTDVTMPPNDPEAPGPYQIQVRVRLKRSGNNYGQLSNIAQITVNP